MLILSVLTRRTIKPGRGNSLAYGLDRLSRERPDLLARRRRALEKDGKVYDRRCAA
jgi:hypothetical protein